MFVSIEAFSLCLPMSAGTSMFSFSLRSIAVLVKSVIPDTPEAMRLAAVKRARRRFLMRVLLRSGAGLMISASRSSRSVVSSSWISGGN